jgi:hypothetical protein
MTLKTKVVEPRGSALEGVERADSTPPGRDRSTPLMGMFAVGFGVLSIFSFAPLFTPLGILFGIIALFMGQVLLGVSAIGLSVIGLLTSPTFLSIASVVAFLGWLGL